MIYFDRETQCRLVQRLGKLLEPGGYLFVGHSESLNGMDHGLHYVQPAIYRKPGQFPEREDHQDDTGGGRWRNKSS
jgi:chemotaxis protein methyltransferase CheR